MGRVQYSDEQKRRALVVYQRYGPNEAERQTGIRKATLIAWAKEYGVVAQNLRHQELSHSRERRSQRAAAVKRERNQEILEDRLGTVLNLHQLALARELQVLNGIQNPTVSDLRAITQARTTAARDLDIILRAVSANEEERDDAEMIELVKQAFVQAMIDARVPEELQEQVRLAFAYRIRLAASGNLPAATTTHELESGDDDDQDVEDGVEDGEVVA